jgi:branched-subunit amino acid transport protein AzlD
MRARVPSARAASVRALDRLLSHGMLTLITIFCCNKNNGGQEKM